MATAASIVEPTVGRDNAVRVKSLYFAYLGAGGLMMTYWPYHFSALGLTAAAIGVVFAVRTILGIVFQPWITALADRVGRPHAFIFFAFALGVVGAALLTQANGFLAVAIAVWISAPALAAVIPLLDAQIVRGYGLRRYGSFRLWGSAGYGLLVTGFGAAAASLDHARAGEVSVLLYLALAGVGVLVAARLALDETPAPAARMRALHWPGRGFGLFVAANATHWASIMIFNVYLSLHTRDLGMASWVPGVAVGVAIIGEVAAFALAGRWIHRLPPVPWLVGTALVGAARWGATALAVAPSQIVIVQLLHFATFGVWFSMAMRLLGRFGPPERRGSLQGLFSALCFGVGGTLGSVVGGVVIDLYSTRAVFGLAAAVELAAVVLFIAAGRVMPPETEERA